MKRITGKLYSTSALFNVGTYHQGALERLVAVGKKRLRRHPGVRPPAEHTERNAQFAEDCFHLSSDAHKRKQKDGSVTLSGFAQSVHKLNSFDNGDQSKLDWHL